MKLWRAVAMWAIAFAVVFYAVVELNVPVKLATSLLAGLVFGAIAHLSQSAQWKYLKSKELNPLSKKFGESSAPRPIEPAPAAPRLNSIAQRVWFLVMLSGFLVCSFGYGVFKLEHPHRDFVEILFDRPYDYWFYKKAMICGITLSLFGYILAFHYNLLLAPVVNWVKKGGTN
jgi:hypothetical protein